MSVILVDTNIILDVLTNNPKWCDWSLQKIETLENKNQLIINSIIYSEVSIGFDSKDELDKTIHEFGFSFKEIDKLSLFKAGKAFMKYKKNGGSKQSPLPDFYIGAQAETNHYKILTRDKLRYKSYFPNVSLIVP